MTDHQRIAARFGIDAAAARVTEITGSAQVAHPTEPTAMDRASAILARDRSIGRRIGMAAAPWLRGAATWLAFAFAYDVATGQWAFLPWHNVKTAWDGLLDKPLGPKNWTILRHLIRGLPEGVGFGVAKSRGKSPVSKRKLDRERARVAGDDMVVDSAKPSTGTRLSSSVRTMPVAAATLGAVFGAGYLLVQYKAGSHMGVVGHDAQVVGQAIASFTKHVGVPASVRDAFALNNGMENTGRVAGLASHTAGRIAGRKVRRAMYEYEVNKAMAKIEAGTLTTTGIGKSGAIAHEAAVRITKGYRSGVQIAA